MSTVLTNQSLVSKEIEKELFWQRPLSGDWDSSDESSKYFTRESSSLTRASGGNEKNPIPCTIIGPNVSAEACASLGCIWLEKEKSCRIYQALFGYSKAGEPSDTKLGFEVPLKLAKPHAGVTPWPKPKIQVESWTDKILRVSIRKTTGPPPFEVRPHLPSFMEKPSRKPENPSLQASFESPSAYPDLTYLTVVRDGDVVFQTDPGSLVLGDNFLSVTNVAKPANIYGFGENFHPSLRRRSGEVWGIFARDHPVGPDTRNLYGHHPFYVGQSQPAKNGEKPKAVGVLFLNSNAMDVSINEDYSVTYRTIGGILDFYILDGPSMHEVVDEYYNLIGRPMMPPYWTLGFQLCRYGYANDSHIRTVFDRVKDLDVPFDTQYADIDYMRDRLSFTYDPIKFGGLPKLTKYVHDHDRKFMVIVDPAIAFDNATTGDDYEPKNLGLKKNLFILDNRTGDPLIGKVWPPGTTVFPDFTRLQDAADYYKALNEDFWIFEGVLFDGLWIDMNEPANFETGSSTGCANNALNYPQWLPNINVDKYIFEKTICMDAQQAWGNHYDVHSLYGYSQAVVTYNSYKAMVMFKGKRPFVLTRSTFPGSGHYAAHWLGDNSSTWEQLKHSIIAMFEFGLFGIPMNGPDICGFFDDATEELCTRWMQVGAFYPFSRNHNALNQKEQDPGAFSETHASIVKTAMETRYKLLPYLYTLLRAAHVGGGGMVARALVYNYPDDVKTWDLSSQFMWGKGLLISPALDSGQTEVDAYLPGEHPWFDLWTGVEAEPDSGNRQIFPAPMEKINVHVAGGNVIPLQLKGDGEIGRTTVACRLLPMGAIAALDYEDVAKGELFWDDGESDSDDHALYKFVVSNGVFSLVVEEKVGDVADSLIFDNLWIYMVDLKKPSEVRVDGEKHDLFNFVAKSKTRAMLHITAMNLTMTENHRVSWV